MDLYPIARAPAYPIAHTREDTGGPNIPGMKSSTTKDAHLRAILDYAKEYINSSIFIYQEQQQQSLSNGRFGRVWKRDDDWNGENKTSEGLEKSEAKSFRRIRDRQRDLTRRWSAIWKEIVPAIYTHETVVVGSSIAFGLIRSALLPFHFFCCLVFLATTQRIWGVARITSSAYIRVLTAGRVCVYIGRQVKYYVLQPRIQ